MQINTDSSGTILIHDNNGDFHPATPAELTTYAAEIKSFKDQWASKQSDFDGWNDCTMKALCKILLDEINILRVEAGFPARTVQQFKDALKSKM